MLRGALLAVLVVALAVPAIGTSAASNRSDATRSTALEVRLLREVNAVRAGHGLRPLAASRALTRSALTHSRAMIESGFFAHESLDGTPFSTRVKRFYPSRTDGWTIGENLVMFGGGAPTAKAVVQTWMASPGHRANLLRPMFREAGFGVIHHPAAGGVFEGLPTWVVTLDLGRR